MSAITTRQLAAELGVVPRTIQKWCRNRRRPDEWGHGGPAA